MIKSKEKYFDISGKVIVLTGGLGLIGLNYTDALVKNWGKVCIIDLIDDKIAHRILENKYSKEELGQIKYYKGDITNKKNLIDIRDKIIKTFGKIDVLINNAALTHKVENLSNETITDYSFENLSLDDWNKEIKVNLTGTMLCCQVFGSKMRLGSSVVNISSIYGVVAPDQGIYSKDYKQPATYSVTKAGIIVLTKYLATYWGGKGIRVNCIVPGGVENGQDKSFIAAYSRRVPMGRMAMPHEMNGALLFLVSDASSYCTGMSLLIDGGWTAW